MSLILASSVVRTPKKPSEPTTKLTWKERFAMAFTAGVIAFDVWVDIHGLSGLSNSILLWWAVVGLVIGIALLHEARKSFGIEKETSTQPKINQAILNRWGSVRASLGISSLEPTADIRQFPVELKQIQALRETREKLSGKRNRPKRDQLDERILTIMQEALDPLARQLRYFRESSERINAMVTAADTDVVNTLKEIRGTAAHNAAEAHADHLLRWT